MISTHKKDFEKAYKRFLKIADTWRQLVEEYGIFHDTNATGNAFRHVALTHDVDVLHTAEHLIAEWQAFADLCRLEENKSHSASVVDAIYNPVPFILKEPAVTPYIVHQKAISTRLYSRETILDLYDKYIKKTAKSPAFSEAVKKLRIEREFFESEPPASQYRARKDGYTDSLLVIDLVDGGCEKFRVNAHGALVYLSNPEEKIGLIDHLGEGKSNTIYAGLKPLLCSPLAGHSVYRLSDIEGSLNKSASRAYIERCIAFRNKAFALKVKQVRAATPTNSPAKSVIDRKIKTASEAMKQLNEMDAELLKIMLSSGDSLEGIKLTEARKKYGQSIEEKHGITFSKIAGRAKIRTSKI